MWNDNLRICEHDSVCTVLELCGFGEEYVGAFEEELSYDKIPDIESLKAHLRYCVEEHDEEYKEYGDDWSNKSVHRVALITAYTVHTQPSAEGFLRELGFTQVGPIKKLKHPSTELSMWHMTATDFLAAIKETS